MRKINWKTVNTAFWIEIILSYVLPFRTVDHFQYKVGFPLSFLTIYDAEIGVNPLMSMNLNPLTLLCNGIMIYLILLFAAGAYKKLKHRDTR